MITRLPSFGKILAVAGSGGRRGGLGAAGWGLGTAEGRMVQSGKTAHHHNCRPATEALQGNQSFENSDMCRYAHLQSQNQYKQAVVFPRVISPLITHCCTALLMIPLPLLNHLPWHFLVLHLLQLTEQTQFLLTQYPWSEQTAFGHHHAQAAHAQPDDIVLTFGYLLNKFRSLCSSHSAVQDAVITSLEKHWNTLHKNQDIFIAAVILNPAYKTTPFNTITPFTNAGIIALILQLWSPFDGKNPPTALCTALLEYLSFSNDFEFMKVNLQMLLKMSHKTVSPLITPLFSIDWSLISREQNLTLTSFLWCGTEFEGKPPPWLTKLANHILSVCPNSAWCLALLAISWQSYKIGLEQKLWQH